MSDRLLDMSVGRRKRGAGIAAWLSARRQVYPDAIRAALSYVALLKGILVLARPVGGALSRCC